jgi:tripartite-type tricarboxylate transporter receptor subunit TctC
MNTLNTSRRLLSRRILATLLAVAATTSLVPAFAQADFPSKPITIVVPFPPAGSTDVMGRLLGQTMSKFLGQTVLIENVGGAGGTIGAAKVARAANDGYTLLFNNMAQASAPSFYARLSYDPVTSFEPIGEVADVPMILVSRKNLPQSQVGTILAYAKANPGKLNFANAGTGATSQLCELLLQTTTGSKWTSVPYKGTGPALNDLLGEQVDLTCDQPASTLGHIKSGNLKPIAVATRQRLGVLPDVPTFAESGVPGFELAVWHGLYAPRGTPRPVVEKLAAALRQALVDPVFVQRCNEMNALIVPADRATPDALKGRLTKDVERWKTTLRAVGIQPE